MTRPAGSAWRVVGASIQGVSHARAGQPCQDTCVWIETDSGALVAAVADGAGSAALAEIGSAIAVQAAAQNAAARLHAGAPRTETGWQALLEEVLQAACQDVLEQADLLELPAQDLSTTLILVIALADQVAAVQIGDGAAVIRLGGDQFVSVTQPPVGEYINETSFLTSGGLLENAQFRVVQGRITGVSLFSDGLQMLALKMPQGTPYAPFFQPLLRFVMETADPERAAEQLQTFLQSPRIAQRADDDLTLVLAVPHSLPSTH
jgi:serine/threonine protein phosphatase PrpC